MVTCCFRFVTAVLVNILTLSTQIIGVDDLRFALGMGETNLTPTYQSLPCLTSSGAIIS
jgi:hypothetical protein